MILKIEIDFKVMKEGKKTVENRVFERDFDDLPLVIVESLQAEGLGEMRQGIAEYLDLTPDESRQLTVRHVKQFTAAIEAAQKIPNE